VTVAAPEIAEKLAIVMAHPDDEVLWACSALRAAEKIVLVYGPMRTAPKLTEGRRAAMAAFPLETLDWLEMLESEVYDSACWPNPREMPYGLYPHRVLRLLGGFDAQRYRDGFAALQDTLRQRLTGMHNVIVHSPWGEYGHEDHVQVFRAVASLADELKFTVWVPGYYAEKSEMLMRRSLRYFGAPTAPMPIDAGLADEISQIYKRTSTWTWFDEYTWPETERFFRHFPQGAPQGQVATEDQLRRIVFPERYAAIVRSLRKPRREAIRSVLSWMNGRRAG
jgi:LmbE family N-acetylglucosaminyl deacetylase